jgi:hypothetical protein
VLPCHERISAHDALRPGTVRHPSSLAERKCPT